MDPMENAAPAKNAVPFEDSSLPFVQRLLRTAGMAFSEPVRLFSGMRGDGLGAPLVYGTIVGTVSGVFAILWNMLFGGLSWLAGGARADEFAIGTGLSVLLLLFCPLLVLVGLFVSTALLHVALLILGDGQRGFAVTFRAVAYGNTPTLLGAVPFCGGIVGGVWALALVILGAKHGHGTDWWRAILGYFLPAICCCCLALWLATTFGLIAALAD